MKRNYPMLLSWPIGAVVISLTQRLQMLSELGALQPYVKSHLHEICQYY